MQLLIWALRIHIHKRVFYYLFQSVARISVDHTEMISKHFEMTLNHFAGFPVHLFFLVVQFFFCSWEKVLELNIVDHNHGAFEIRKQKANKGLILCFLFRSSI